MRHEDKIATAWMKGEGNSGFVRWFGVCERCLCLHTRWAGVFTEIVRVRLVDPNRTEKEGVVRSGRENLYHVNLCGTRLRAVSAMSALTPGRVCQGRVARVGSEEYQDRLEAAYLLGGAEAVTAIVINDVGVINYEQEDAVKEVIRRLKEM